MKKKSAKRVVRVDPKLIRSIYNNLVRNRNEIELFESDVDKDAATLDEVEECLMMLVEGMMHDD